jgi:hypothetical protein
MRRAHSASEGEIVKNNRGYCLAACAVLVLVVGMLFGLSGCQSLDGTEGATTTVAPEETTTTVAGPPVEVTKETSESPCYIREAFTRDGQNYIVVDYITVTWPTDYNGSHHLPKVTNTNKKLRTFVVPDDAYLQWNDGEFSFEDLVAAVESGDINVEYEYSDFGYWDISVDVGYVVSLSAGVDPSGDFSEDEGDYEEDDY